MTLIDPTSGTGYVTGQRLPSADMTTIATQQPDAIDGVGGGTYAPSSAIQVNGSGMGFGAIPTLTSQTITIMQPLTPISPSTGGVIGTDWYFPSDGAWRSNAPPGGTVLQFPLSRIPQAQSVLTAIRFRLRGQNYTALPSVMPQIQPIIMNESDTLAAANPVNAGDSSGTTGAFNAYHTITWTAITTITIGHTANRNQVYVLFNYADGGATGAFRFLQMIRLEADFTVTKLSAG